MPGLWRQTRHSWAATRGADYAPKWLACGVAGLVYGAGCPYAHQTGAFVVLCCMGLMVFWADFRCFALRWPGLAPAGDILSCHATRKDAKKRAPLPRPLRGCPRSGRAARGLRKLALRAQTCATLIRPSHPPLGASEGERKGGRSTAGAAKSGYDSLLPAKKRGELPRRRQRVHLGR